MIYKIILTLFFITFSFSSQWISTNTTEIEKPRFNLVNSEINNTIIDFSFDDFYFKDVSIDEQNYSTVHMKNGASNLDLGHPDLAHISKSIIIPDNALMNIEIIDTEYVVYENILIAPSKGNISKAKAFFETEHISEARSNSA